jgi:hypothetical protein
VAELTVSVALPVRPPNAAEIWATPGLIEPALPNELTVATAVLSELHVALAETSCVDESLKVAVAMSTCCSPTGMVELIGVTVTDWTVRTFTSNARFPLMPL